jgi:hypothetical protein
VRENNIINPLLVVMEYSSYVYRYIHICVGVFNK